MNDVFADFSRPLIGLPVSWVWRGYGSALFLEFGRVSSGRRRRDGSLGNPEGEMTLMIQWSWRIEGRRTILGGSWSEEWGWPRLFKLLKGATVRQATLFGRLPEVEVILSNDVRLLSFQTSSGGPEWSLFDKSNPVTRWCTVRRGRVVIEESEKRHIRPTLRLVGRTNET
jgi:hypothetical protein